MYKLQDDEVEFVEHESGPELLLYLAVTTAGLGLAKSALDLITTIIKARSEGVKKGDDQRHPIELIVRKLDKDGNTLKSTSCAYHQVRMSIS